MAAIDRLNGLASETTLGIKAPCLVATSGVNISLSGAQVVDGVTVGNNNERVLVKDQTDPTENGIYIASTGNWLRAQDSGGNTDWTAGTSVVVSSGAVNAGATFRQTTAGPVILGVAALVFAALTLTASVIGVGVPVSGDTGATSSLGLSVFTGSVSSPLTSVAPTVYISRVENQSDGGIPISSSALLVNAHAVGASNTQTQAISAVASQGPQGTNDVCAILGYGYQFASPASGTTPHSAFGGFFYGLTATTYAYACAFAIETTTVNGTGVSTPYNPIPGTAPIHCGIDLDYIGTSNWSGSFSTPANGGPAIQIRADDGLWDVGVAFMDSRTGHLGSIYKASLQDDTQSISLFLATAHSNHQYGLNWSAASFSVAAIATPGFTVDGAGKTTIPAGAAATPSLVVGAPGYGLYQGSSALQIAAAGAQIAYFSGAGSGVTTSFQTSSMGILTAALSSAALAIVAGTTSAAQINFGASTAPTSPNNGDFWFDGTNFKARVGGATKTFTIA